MVIYDTVTDDESFLMGRQISEGWDSGELGTQYYRFEFTVFTFYVQKHGNHGTFY